MVERRAAGEERVKIVRTSCREWVFGFLQQKHDYKIYKCFAQHETNAKKQNTSLAHSPLEQSWPNDAMGWRRRFVHLSSVHRTHGRVCVCVSRRHRVRWICDTEQNAECWLAPDTLLICGVVLADLTLSRSQAQSLARANISFRRFFLLSVSFGNFPFTRMTPETELPLHTMNGKAR